MENYIKPTFQRNTDKVILDIGTNDLKSKKEPLEIASSIINLAKACWENGFDTIILEILPRGDRLNESVQEVNTASHELCGSDDLWIIGHQRVRPWYRLSWGKLHPGLKGTIMIEASFNFLFNGWLVAAVAHGVSGTDSSFRVGWRTAGGV